jgi:hypothetical protein
MIAHENDKQGWRVLEIIASDELSVRVWQGKIGRIGPQFQHGARGTNHR